MVVFEAGLPPSPTKTPTIHHIITSSHHHIITSSPILMWYFCRLMFTASTIISCLLLDMPAAKARPADGAKHGGTMHISSQARDGGSQLSVALITEWISNMFHKGPIKHRHEPVCVPHPHYLLNPGLTQVYVYNRCASTHQEVQTLYGTFIVHSVEPSTLENCKKIATDKKLGFPTVLADGRTVVHYRPVVAVGFEPRHVGNCGPVYSQGRR